MRDGIIIPDGSCAPDSLKKGRNRNLCRESRLILRCELYKMIFRSRKKQPEQKERSIMPWYWILIILSAIVGPFEAMHALNKARKNREAAEKREAGPDEADRKE